MLLVYEARSICLCICVYVSFYNIHSTYVCFLSWVSSYFVMQKLSLTSIISEMTNYNEVDDSQYNLYICIWLFQMLKIKYLDMKWFQRHQIRTENKMKNYETMNGNFISLAALISRWFVVDLKILEDDKWRKYNEGRINFCSSICYLHISTHVFLIIDLFLFLFSDVLK